ncbi:MAG: hypothetical protein E6I92_08020 [Chloroflexi bacterium]|nr:MAG: hypothetical protein E6I92_08020 [Chloroflexota bacterium]
MTSRPLRFDVMRTGVATWPGVSSGDAEGSGDSGGDGVGVGDGMPESRAKFAHGFGWTLMLAQSLCTPGASPPKGLTRELKLPFASAVADPATLLGWSQ